MCEMGSADSVSWTSAGDVSILRYTHVRVLRFPWSLTRSPFTRSNRIPGTTLPDTSAGFPGLSEETAITLSPDSVPSCSRRVRVSRKLMPTSPLAGTSVTVTLPGEAGRLRDSNDSLRWGGIALGPRADSCAGGGAGGARVGGSDADTPSDATAAAAVAGVGWTRPVAGGGGVGGFGAWASWRSSGGRCAFTGVYMTSPSSKLTLRALGCNEAVEGRGGCTDV
mmetsp:Transcript_1081/g.3101  ORF Transcript_1081/g.3101 Transcript_1081/m.3101 type:complete len:223 (-) Transcript_1081:701-1369(-)